MPYSLKRLMTDKPRVKEWRSITHKNGYVEIVKFKTLEEANAEAAEWGGNVEVVEVPHEAGAE